jgi:hypothetical protein
VTELDSDEVVVTDPVSPTQAATTIIPGLGTPVTSGPGLGDIKMSAVSNSVQIYIYFNSFDQLASALQCQFQCQ